MTRITKGMRSTSGFTLLEILVALVLIGLLAGALVPTVVNQLGRGETNRLVEDLTAIEGASKSFRVDVQRWPGGLRNLVTQPSTSDVSLTGATYPSALISRWRGPYLERGSIPGDTIVTAGGGVILPTFTSVAWGGTNFFTVKVKGITQENARAARLVMDGDTAVAATSGRVRWKTGGGSSPDTLIFHAAPAL
jgi:type II secretion system protein G